MSEEDTLIVNDVSEETGNEAPTVSKEEMLDLVRAIKFAKPDASMRQVHREITEQLSQNASFEFLSLVKLNDVKKVWKKAVQESAAKREEGLPGENNEVWKLYTVGNGSVKSLAQEYSLGVAKAVAEQAQAESDKLLQQNYVHVFLDVPADRSGQRPHQAIINFNDNTTTGVISKSLSNDSASNKDLVVKIQVAAAPDGTKFPMLLYNQDRTLKTFIHPQADNNNNDDDDDGYDRIFHLITKEGVGGMLGASGGTKAYFFVKVTKRKQGPNILSIDTRQLAPHTTW